jgi:hypothetical protein
MKMGSIDTDNIQVRRIASRLATARGYAPQGPWNMTEGFSMPTWALFYSEAEQIWLTHILANDLEWNGNKRK